MKILKFLNKHHGKLMFFHLY